MAVSMFSTLSTNIAAFLLSRGIAPTEVVGASGKTYFFYERTQDLQEGLDAYNNNIQLKKFISSFKEIKEMMKR